MRYEGCSSDTAVVVNRRRPSRRREICRSFTCISPWFIFCRWLNDGKSRASRTESDERNWGKEKIGGVVDVQTNVGSVSSSSKEVFSISEIGKEDSFNHGGGFGLIFLVRHELNKMVELQKRMESLPLNSQTEVDNQDQKHLSVPSKSSISSSLAKSCVQEILHGEEHTMGQGSSRNDVEQLEIGFGRSKLEAEFNRLQMHEVNVEHIAPEMSLNMCYEEGSEEHESSRDAFCGVSPRDLERRLHQVLELRQQERISELESALNYAMQQLEEKETELSLWRDAACLVARHLQHFGSDENSQSNVGETSRNLIQHPNNLEELCCPSF